MRRFQMEPGKRWARDAQVSFEICTTLGARVMDKARDALTEVCKYTVFLHVFG